MNRERAAQIAEKRALLEEEVKREAAINKIIASKYFTPKTIFVLLVMLMLQFYIRLTLV